MTFVAFSLPGRDWMLVIRNCSNKMNRMDARIAWNLFETFLKRCPCNLGEPSHLRLISKAFSDKLPTMDEVPIEKHVPERIDLQSERAYLAGASPSMNQKWFITIWKKSLKKLGIIFTDTDSALKRISRPFKQYFKKLVPPTDNKLLPSTQQYGLVELIYKIVLCKSRRPFKLLRITTKIQVRGLSVYLDYRGCERVSTMWKAVRAGWTYFTIASM